MPKHSLSDNILTTGDEEMTLGGRIYASRRNAGISLHMAANPAWSEIINTEILGK